MLAECFRAGDGARMTSSTYRAPRSPPLNVVRVQRLHASTERGRKMGRVGQHNTIQYTSGKGRVNKVDDEKQKLGDHLSSPLCILPVAAAAGARNGDWTLAVERNASCAGSCRTWVSCIIVVGSIGPSAYRTPDAIPDIISSLRIVEQQDRMVVNRE